jgi:hypothetical protein
MFCNVTILLAAGIRSDMVCLQGGRQSNSSLIGNGFKGFRPRRLYVTCLYTSLVQKSTLIPEPIVDQTSMAGYCILLLILTIVPESTSSLIPDTTLTLIPEPFMPHLQAWEAGCLLTGGRVLGV